MSTAVHPDTDFSDAQITEYLRETPTRDLFERDGLGTEMLRRTHIGTGSGSDGRNVRGVMAQAHEANRLRRIVYSTRNYGDGNNSSYYHP